jgi:membrane protein
VFRKLRHLARIVGGSLYEWNQDKAPRMAAALAFYTIFALTPIVIVSVTVGGLFFGRAEAQSEVLEQARFLIGEHGERAIVLLIENAPQRPRSWMASIIGLLAMFIAATGAFAELKDSLNTIWEVQPRPGLGLADMVKARFLSFAIVLVLGFFLLVSLAISAALEAASRGLVYYVPVLDVVRSGSAMVSMAGVTVLFALIYKVMPDARVAWRDVWLGALVAACLFGIGKLLFGLYLGQSEIGSSYGAAGSLVIVVLWTYYMSLILLFGAELTQVQARLRGAAIVPQPGAIHVTEHDRLQQGIPTARDVALSANDEDKRQAAATQIQPPRSGRS